MDIFIYAISVSLIIIIGLYLCIHPYLKGKTPKLHKIGIILFLTLYFVHDLFMTLCSPHLSAAKEWCEMLLYYFLAWLVLQLFFQGKSFINFVTIFAVDFLFQALGSLFLILILGMFDGFDMQLLQQRVNTPMIANLLPLGVSTITCAIILRIVLQRIMKDNLFTHIVSGILAGMTMVASSMNGVRSLVIVIPLTFLVLIIGLSYQEYQLSQSRKQEKYYQQVEERERIRQEELAKIKQDLSNHVSATDIPESNGYANEVLNNIDKIEI